jgi:6-phosphogluconolactonase (cycloisomerase 2 family)
MEAFNFISFIGWRFTFRIKKISGISNKMFTQTVRELEKTALFPEKFSGSSSQSGIQIDRERKIV